MKYKVLILVVLVIIATLFCYRNYNRKKIVSPRDRIIFYVKNLNHYETRSDFENNLNSILSPEKVIFSGSVGERGYFEESVEIPAIPEISIIITMQKKAYDNLNENSSSYGEEEIFAISIYDLKDIKNNDDDEEILWWHHKAVKKCK